MNLAEYSDVAAYRLSLSEDTKAINQLVCVKKLYQYSAAEIAFLFFDVMLKLFAEHTYTRGEGNGFRALHI